MPWSSQAIIAQTVIIEGAGDSLLVYNGTPAAGNLIGSIVSIGQTDQFGNKILAGIASYAPGGPGFVACQLFGGAESFYTATTEAGPWSAVGFLQPAGTNDGNLELDATSGYLLLASFGSTLAVIGASGDATGATDTASIKAGLAGGNSVLLLPGTFAINCADSTLTNLGVGQYIWCSGEISTKINAVGSGDLFGWQQTAAYNGFTTIGGGIRGGCTIDMGATTAASNGIHAGDIEGLIFEATVQNATQPGSFGFLFDNRNHFTERMRGDITAKNCDTHVAFTVSGATTSTKSFARPNMDIKITQGASSNGDGVALLNGAELYDGRISIRGNFSSSASALTSAVLRVTGSVPVGHPGAGTLSKIDHCQLDIGVEVDSAHANTPSTIIYGASGNNIKANGNMDFIGAFTASNLNGGNMVYDGLIDGDTTIGSRFYYGEDAAQSITANGQTIRVSGVAAAHPVSATGAFTGIIMGAGAFGGQVIWVFNTGANTLTFAASPGSNLSAAIGTNFAAGVKLQLVWDVASALWY